MESQETVVCVPKLYKRNALDLMMFGFIEGVKTAMPTLTIQQCIILFNKKINTPNEDYSIEVDRNKYNRMKNEYYESL
jgi:hypothetical protein